MSLNQSIVEDAAAQRSTRLAHKPTVISLDALKTKKKGLMQQLFPSPEEVEA